MASKRRLRRKGCEGKVRYLTHKDAVFAVGRVIARTKGDKMNIYKCAFCGGAYHLGHLTRRAQRLRGDP